MRFTPTALDGVVIVDLEPYVDERGLFARTFCAEEFARQGLSPVVAQANLQMTAMAGTVRGLHYQVAPALEAKLVRCVRGAAYDVVVDVRPGSATWGRWIGVDISADNNRAVYVAQGCAHGMQALADDTALYYQMSTPYTPGTERGVRYDDADLAIPWPLPVTQVSDKDVAQPPLRAADSSYSG